MINQHSINQSSINISLQVDNKIDPKDPDWKPPYARPEPRHVTWRCEICGQIGAGSDSRSRHRCPMDKSKVLYTPYHRTSFKQESSFNQNSAY